MIDFWFGDARLRSIFFVHNEQGMLDPHPLNIVFPLALKTYYILNHKIISVPPCKKLKLNVLPLGSV